MSERKRWKEVDGRRRMMEHYRKRYYEYSVLWMRGGMKVKKFCMFLLAAMMILTVGCGGTDQAKNERAEKGEVVISVGSIW